MEELDAAEFSELTDVKRSAGSKRKNREEAASKRNKAAKPADAADAAAAATASDTLDPAIAIAADAAREKLASRQADARTASTQAARAASGQLGGLNPDGAVDGAAAAVAAETAADVGVAGSNEAALTDADQAFYRYTEQHVSQKTQVNGKDGKSALSEVCYPPGWDLENNDASGEHFVRPAKAAKEYPFELDPFQRYAVDCLERNQSVLVAAHTSAGKVRAHTGTIE